MITKSFQIQLDVDTALENLVQDSLYLEAETILDRFS